MSNATTFDFKQLNQRVTDKMKAYFTIALLLCAAVSVSAHAQQLTFSNINNEVITKGQMMAQYQISITSPATPKNLRNVENILVVRYIVPDGALSMILKNSGTSK